MAGKKVAEFHRESLCYPCNHRSQEGSKGLGGREWISLGRGTRIDSYGWMKCVVGLKWEDLIGREKEAGRGKEYGEGLLNLRAI